MKTEPKKAPKRPDPEIQRINREIENLQIEQDTSFPALNIEPLKLLVRQGALIGEIYRSGDLITVNVSWPNGQKSTVFQEIGARDALVDNGGDNDAVTISVKSSGKRKKLVVDGYDFRQTYTSQGSLDTHEEGGALHKFKNGQRIYSEDVVTGKKYYYFLGTDTVDFIENAAGEVIGDFTPEQNVEFQVQLQPTRFLVVQNNKKLMAKPKLRLRRLRAYKKKIRAHVKAPRVSGDVETIANVKKLQKTRQVVMVAGVVLVSNTKPLGSLQGMFGLSEGLIAAFLRSGPAYGGSAGNVFAKPTAVASTTAVARTSDDAVPVRVGTLVSMIVMSEGAFLVMANTQTDSSDMAREGWSVRRDGRDSAKPSVKLKGAMLHASHKPEVSRVGAPVMMTRGSMPTLRGERYIVSRRPAIDIRMTSGAGKQSPLFRGSVLSSTPGNQWVVPAALPTVNNVARVDSKASVRETLRQPLVMKTGRGSRDSGSGSNPHHGSDDKQKKQQPKQADS